MKNLYILSALLFLATAVFAQGTHETPQNYQKGTFFGAGFSNFGLSSLKTSESGDKQFNINARLAPGYFFHDNWAAGLNVEYGHSNFTVNSGTTENKFADNTMGFGPWVRKYFQVPGLHGSPYAMADFGMGTEKLSGDIYANDQVYNNNYYHLGIGWSMEMCCDCVDFDCGLSYCYKKSWDKDASSIHNTTTGLQLDLGFDIHFPFMRGRLK